MDQKFLFNLFLKYWSFIFRIIFFDLSSFFLRPVPTRFVLVYEYACRPKLRNQLISHAATERRVDVCSWGEPNRTQREYNILTRQELRERGEGPFW